MDHVDNSGTQTVEQLQKEVRALTRKLALAETNLNRANSVSTTRARVENILGLSLQKELQFFKLVLENTTSILLLFDFDCRFAYASRVFLDKAGIANFGIINGRKLHEVLGPIISGDNLTRFSAAVTEATEALNTVTLEDEIDFGFVGDARTFSILITPMTDDTGKSTGIMALFNDITDINNALETAKRASLAKSEFLANMSHEIRTPLNAILGMAAIAQTSGDPDKIHYCLDKINDSSSLLLGVINDILDMSKIETKHFELSYSEFVFEKMLLRIVEVMRFKIDEKHIQLEVICDPDIPYIVRSDEQRLTQVIMNLMSNAVKFTPIGGSITLRAAPDRSERDKCMLRISVEDSGIGIPEEQKPRLFKAFSQADSSISRKYGGTGLGLAISRNIVGLMGGDIWCESRESEGATFTFTVETDCIEQNPPRNPDYCNLRLMMVGGSALEIDTFARNAAKLGAPCARASDVDEVMSLLQDAPYDILFVDWAYGEAAEAIHKLKRQDGVRLAVAVIRASDRTKYEDAICAAGADDIVSKPFALPILQDVLNMVCVQEETGDAQSADDFSGKTILLADDVDINREIILALLEDTGVDIVCAENGRQAVQLYSDDPERYDFVFMDVQMPEMDGYEATRQIRGMGATLPIVAMTANVFKEDIERCLASGMNDHIGKPISFDEILSILRRWLSEPQKTPAP